jgi:hypothetical protein
MVNLKYLCTQVVHLLGEIILYDQFNWVKHCLVSDSKNQIAKACSSSTTATQHNPSFNLIATICLLYASLYANMSALQ